MDMPQVPITAREDCPARYRCIGSCSVCFGPVLSRDYGAWSHPEANKTATCDHCGATARTPYGPTIDMVPAGDMRKAWADMTEEQRKAALNSGALS